MLDLSWNFPASVILILEGQVTFIPDCANATFNEIYALDKC